MLISYLPSLASASLSLPAQTSTPLRSRGSGSLPSGTACLWGRLPPRSLTQAPSGPAGTSSLTGPRGGTGGLAPGPGPQRPRPRGARGRRRWTQVPVTREEGPGNRPFYELLFNKNHSSVYTESCLHKTPKRSLSRKSRTPTFSSPVNDTDIQQEIFWDPHSPIACRLGNEKKKQITSRCAVEISEIVNRIAPQDEKAAYSGGSLLETWIGEDAIPCTPGVVKLRARTKLSCTRIWKACLICVHYFRKELYRVKEEFHIKAL
uniref:Uncharacterized protein n=1 Tax=Apteryx owenii TaxID=8824 RepID=A0A8B9Q775_APTOW